MRKALLLSLALDIVPAAAQTDISNYVPGITPEGITYFLPRTQLRITVHATCRTYKPGDFRKYAMRYLRLNNIPQEKQTHWTIDNVSITEVGIPDKEKAYSIKLRQKTSAPLTSLSQSGILLSVNAKASEPNYVQPATQPAVQPTIYNPRDYMTEEILSAGSESKMAELTAAEIYDLRESRNLLVKGEADFMPKDGEQLKLMIQQLSTQETALLQLFKGTETYESRTFTFTYDPAQDTERDLLFRFSQKLGPVDADDLAGAPVYIRIENLQTLPPVQEADNAKTAKKKELNDLRYNVPSQVKVKVFTSQQTLAEGTYAMGQFGRVEHLGEDLFNKKMGTRVYLNPVSGGLEKLDLEQPQ